MNCNPSSAMNCNPSNAMNCSESGAMNCEQFQDRMDALLDLREDLNGDEQICDHARECSSCRERLAVWSEISVAVRPDIANGCQRELAPKRSAMTDSHRFATVIAIAAGILVIVSVGRWIASPSQSSNQTIASVEMPKDLPAADSQSRPGNETVILPPSPGSLAWQTGGWWSEMADEQWVNHTIPAVNSVRQGVAPIGRSMRQAFAILLIQSRETPIRSVTPEIQSQPFGEQTSTVYPPMRPFSMA